MPGGGFRFGVRLETLGVEEVNKHPEPPLWRVSRRLHGPIARRVYTKDGQKLILYAYQKGIPPVVTPGAWDFAPAIFGVGQYVFLYLRYRFRYKGTYVLDVRDPSGKGSLASQEFDNRSRAMREMEQVIVRLNSRTRDAVAHVFAIRDDNAD